MLTAFLIKARARLGMGELFGPVVLASAGELRLSHVFRSFAYMESIRRVSALTLFAFLVSSTGALSQHTRIPQVFQVDSYLSSRLAGSVRDLDMDGDDDVGGRRGSNRFPSLTLLPFSKGKIAS